MKQFWKASLCGAMSLALLGLTGCGDTTTDSTPPASETVNLVLWHYYNGNTKDSFDVLVSEFNNTVGAEKNIVVEANSYGSVSDLSSAVVSSANKEVGMPDMPHIFAAYSDTALLVDDMGLVASMDDYFSAEELALFQQDFLNEGRFDSSGELKIIPVAKSTEIILINHTDFEVFAEATGVSLDQLETWEGIAEVAKEYYEWTDGMTPDVEHDGKAFFGVDSEANFLLLAAKQLGEELYLYDGDEVSFGLSESAAKTIWDGVIVPYIHGYYASYGSYRSDDVKSGDLLAYAGSTSSVFYFPSVIETGREASKEIDGVAMAYPYFEEGEKVAVQQGAGMVVAKSDPTHEAAAAEFLKWFTSVENNLAFAVSTGYIPVQNEALTLDGVFAEMGTDFTKIVESCVVVTYEELIPEYEFYANKPFEGSYETRNAISDTILGSRAEYQEALAASENRAETIEQLIGEESFQAWYARLDSSISEILEG
ncbi:MAG: extracellular solute-binding protein [Eubacteriales bacterium]